jgi:hypothetical protein
MGEPYPRADGDGLQAAYAEAWREWNERDGPLWDVTVADGLSSEDWWPPR